MILVLNYFDVMESSHKTVEEEVEEGKQRDEIFGLFRGIGVIIM